MKKIFIVILALSVLLCACSAPHLQNTSSAAEAVSSVTPDLSSANESSRYSDISIGDITKGEISYTETNSVESSSAQVIAPSDAGTAINFSESGAAITGSGASADGGKVTITSAGIYAISGSSQNCSITVNADKGAVVALVLNSVTLASADGPVIYGISSDRIKLSAVGESTLTDGESYSSATDENPNACVWSQDDITVCGSGTLTVNGRCENGISSVNDIDIKSGVILDVTAVNTAIRGKDSVEIEPGATVIISAGGDGIKASNEEDEGQGIITIHGGDITVTAGEDGLEAISALNIEGGKMLVTTGGGSGKTLSSGQSAKALKSDGGIAVSGGAISINSLDDSLHCGGDCSITDGIIAASSGDDGIHCDESLVISGGYIVIAKSYEGLEAKNIMITGGEISVTASDDGINAAGGSDTQGSFRPGYNPFPSGGNAGNYKLIITGGKLVVNASGDGVDSNGNIEMSGGSVFVSGPTNNGNGAIDYEGSFILTGGIIVAAGASGMAMNVSSSSSQCSVLAFTASCAAGTEVALADASGNALVSFTPEKAFNSVVISTPGIVIGGAYTLTCGGSTEASFTVSSRLTSVGSGGGGFGGGPHKRP